MASQRPAKASAEETRPVGSTPTPSAEVRLVPVGPGQIEELKNYDEECLPLDAPCLDEKDRAEEGPCWKCQQWLPLRRAIRAIVTEYQRTDPNDDQPSPDAKCGTCQGGACDDKAVSELTELREALGELVERERTVRHALAVLIDSVDRDRRESDKVLCHLQTARGVLARLHGIAALATKEEG